MSLEAVRADITGEQVDAIVNAANSALRRGAGVCGAIFAAAGPELDGACAAIGHCDTGDAVITIRVSSCRPSGSCTPSDRSGTAAARPSRALLASCYRRSIEVAAEAGARSIAFPAISTGIFGYPARPAAEIAVATVREHGDALEAIRLVAFDEATFDLYRELLG